MRKLTLRIPDDRAPAPTEDELKEAAAKLYPDAEKLREVLINLRPSPTVIEAAVVRVIENAVGQVIGELCTDYIAVKLDELIPLAVERAVNSTWERRTTDGKTRENLENMVIRKLEEVVHRDIAAKYQVRIEATFHRKEGT